MTNPTEADAERAREIVDQYPVDEGFDANTFLIEEVAAAISAARAEGIAQGRAEMREIDAPVIEAARPPKDGAYTISSRSPQHGAPLCFVEFMYEDGSTAGSNHEWFCRLERALAARDHTLPEE